MPLKWMTASFLAEQPQFSGGIPVLQLSSTPWWLLPSTQCKCKPHIRPIRSKQHVSKHKSKQLHRKQPLHITNKVIQQGLGGQRGSWGRSSDHFDSQSCPREARRQKNIESWLRDSPHEPNGEDKSRQFVDFRGLFSCCCFECCLKGSGSSFNWILKGFQKVCWTIVALVFDMKRKRWNVIPYCYWH